MNDDIPLRRQQSAKAFSVAMHHAYITHTLIVYICIHTGKSAASERLDVMKGVNLYTGALGHNAGS